MNNFFLIQHEYRNSKTFSLFPGVSNYTQSIRKIAKRTEKSFHFIVSQSDVALTECVEMFNVFCSLVQGDIYYSLLQTSFSSALIFFPPSN